MAENTKIIISAVDKTKKGFGSVTSRLKKVTGAVFSMRTALVGVAGVAGFGLLVKSSLNATDSLAKTAAKIGTTTEALGGLRFAAELTGVATNTMDMALQRFTRRTAEAAMGTGEAKAAIKELGLNAQELNRMPLDKRMVVLADAFSGVASESDRLRLAFKLFDSEGAALVNTLSGGGDALKEMLGEARMLGLTMSGSAAKGVEDTVDALTKLQSVFKGVTDQVVAALAPAIEGMVERFTAFLQRSIEARGGVEQFATALAINLLQGVKSALVAFQELTNGFITVHNGALDAKDALTQVFTPDGKKNARQLINDIEEIGQALAKRGKHLDTERAKKLTNFNLEKILYKKDLERLQVLQELLLVAEKSGDGLNRMAKVNFATRINAEIDAMVANLENVKTNIVDLPKVIVPAIGNMEQAFTAWRDTIPDLDVSIKALTTQGLNGLTDALTAGITGAADFADAMKAMAKSVIDSLIKMLIQKYIVDAAFGFITGAIGGGGNANASGNAAGTNLGGSMSFDGGGYTGDGSRSGGMDGKGGFMAMLHPQETVIDHTKNTNNLSKTAEQVQGFQDSGNDRFKSLGRGGLKETIDNKDVRSFDGGGFTGNGSRSGGVDGKGGFNAILHPNETVTDHTKSINKKRNERENTNEENNSIVVNQTINVTTGVQQTVRAEIVQLMPQIAQAAKGAVADARLRGGNFSKAMGGA